MLANTLWSRVRLFICSLLSKMVDCWTNTVANWSPRKKKQKKETKAHWVILSSTFTLTVFVAIVGIHFASISSQLKKEEYYLRMIWQFFYLKFYGLAESETEKILQLITNKNKKQQQQKKKCIPVEINVINFFVKLVIGWYLWMQSKLHFIASTRGVLIWSTHCFD